MEIKFVNMPSPQSMLNNFVVKNGISLFTDYNIKNLLCN